MNVLLDDGEVRCANSLKLLGYYFVVDNTKYLIKL